MKFEMFTGINNQRRGGKRPWRMEVGEIVKRKNVKSDYRRALFSYMRRQMEMYGWKYSIAEDNGILAIRRDK